MASWLAGRDPLSRPTVAEQFYERLNYFSHLSVAADPFNLPGAS
jgi:hypothetical protein